MSQYINTPPQAAGSPAPGPAQRGSQRSGAALAALILGGLSLACFAGPLLGIPGLIVGFVALSKIGRSDGQVTGKGFAITGICLALTGSVLGSFFAYYIVKGMRDVESGGIASSAFETAENNIRSKKTDQIGFGNTPEAAALAEEFATNIKVLRETLFSGDSKGLLSGGEFLTHCELNEDRCAFIVHVPSLRKFNGEAKESLCDIAWMVAQSALEESDFPDGTKLAVGVKGFALYEDIMIGTYARDALSEDHTSGSGPERLRPFFPEPAPAEKEAETPAKEPAPAGPNH